MISYNALLCDEITKPQNLISLQNNQYAEERHFHFIEVIVKLKINISYISFSKT